MKKSFLPLKWIPTVYIMQSIPFALAILVAPILYKNYQWTNTKITFFTSLFILPWILKFIFAPAIEQFATKKFFTWTTQLAIGIFVFLLGLEIIFFKSFILSIILFFLMAISGAIHDINADGIYLDALTKEEQANFIGIRTIFYQVGTLLCQGVFIWLVGRYLFIGKEIVWASAFVCLSIFIFLMALYNRKVIPSSALVKPNITFLTNYSNVIKGFLELPQLSSIILFLIFYQFPSIQLTRIAPLFMMDSVNQGGLHLPVESIGYLFGVIGIISMLVGVTISGILLARFELRKCLIIFAIITVLTNSSYLFLIYSSAHLFNITACVIISELGYGLSNGAYMFYLVALFSKRNNSMSLYAIGTALMLFGNFLAGITSGYFQALLGYQGFFSWILIAGIGSVLLAFVIKNAAHRAN
jgi:PAT family beta-lactamase induction signal transducer AmpG